MIRPECFEYLLKPFSEKEKDLIKWYCKLGKGHKKEAALMAGYPETSAQRVAFKLLGKRNAQQYVKSVAMAAGCKIGWEYEEKLKKLKLVADLAIPDDAETIEDIHHQAGIAAIAESNKMQGHYSAEKIVNTNVNVDVDLQQVHDLLEEYKREY
jgi:hypothetical protein